MPTLDTVRPPNKSRQTIRILCLSILVMVIAGTLNSIVLGPTDPNRAMSTMSAIGYIVFALSLLFRTRRGIGMVFWTVLGLAVSAVAAQRLLEGFVPGWIRLLDDPALDRFGLGGTFSVESAFAVFITNTCLVAHLFNRRVALILLAASWAGATLNLMTMLFEITIWSGPLSVYSLSCMLFASFAMTHVLRSAPVLRPLFSREYHGAELRTMLFGALFVPWLAGVATFRHLPIGHDASRILEVLFAAFSWVLVALVLQVGHLREASLRDRIRAARFDPLIEFVNRFRPEEAQPARDGPLGVILFDLDGFSMVNRRIGQDAADQLLRQTARCIARNVRAEDMVGHWRGQEFLVTVHVPSEAELAIVAERLRRTVSAQVTLNAGGEGLPLTASFGISMVAFDEPNIEEALRRAERALYVAKRQGRNRVIRASGLTGEAI